jgi:lysophospholipase L1-like esterase
MRVRWWAAALTVTLAAAACGGDDDGGPTSTAAGPVRRAVVLGDSFAAGGGAPPYDPAAGGCFRSTRSWPRLLEADLDDLTVVDDRSCGGAGTDQLVGPWPERQQPPQITAAGEGADADLVLLTVGGTDAGLASVLATCVTEDCGGVTSSAAARAARTNLTRRLVEEVYPALQAAYPGARIIHVGYPLVLARPGVAPVGCPWLTSDDQDAALAATDAVDGAITQAVALAAEAGVPVEHVDVTRALDGHELCTADPWVNAAGTPDQLHPLGSGYDAIARAVAAALDG